MSSYAFRQMYISIQHNVAGLNCAALRSLIVRCVYSSQQLLRAFFILSPVFQGSWFDNVLSWSKHRGDSRILFLKYEDMKKVRY